MKRFFTLSFLCVCFFSPACLADSTADGYLLVRILETDNEAAAKLDLRHLDSGAVIKIRSESCSKGSVNSRICLIPAAPGRYFWTRFEMTYNLRGAQSYIEGPSLWRDELDSSDDSVEIVAGGVSYIGDWELGSDNQWSPASARQNLTIKVGLDKTTLQLFYDNFPDVANRYEIYLSVRGKKAVSLQDFLKNVQPQSE